MSLMYFRPFNVHCFNKFYHGKTRKHCARGFTAIISPSDVPRMVNVQLSFCHEKDHFCRKEGARSAAQKPPALINARKLSAYLEEQALKTDITLFDSFDWVLRYIV